jgi:hypothetical protein
VGVAGHSIGGPEQGPQVGQDLRLETLVAVHAVPGNTTPHWGSPPGLP